MWPIVISQAISAISHLPSVITTLNLAGILSYILMNNNMNPDNTAISNFVLVTVNNGERYSCSMSSVTSASPKRESFGHLENLDRLSQETNSNHWQEVEFQVFRTDHNLIWHAGLKITFHSRENSSAYALDWGMNNTDDCLFCNEEIPGRLTLYSLMDHEVKMYEDCNNIINEVTIPIERKVSRSKIYTIMLEIGEFPEDHTYDVKNENTEFRAMNCRGVCWWVMEKVHKAEFEGVNDNDGMSWLNKLGFGSS